MFCVQSVSVSAEQNLHDEEADSFVSVHEGMILGKTAGDAGNFFDFRREKILVAEGLHGGG